MDNANLTLKELADQLGESFETVMKWAAAGMPAMASKPGRYGFTSSLYWRLGHSLNTSLQAKGIALNLTIAQKIAAGWLLSPGPDAPARHVEFAVYLHVLEGVGVGIKEALAALHFALAMLSELEIMPDIGAQTMSMKSETGTRH